MAREDPEWLVRSAADAGLQAQEERVGTPSIVYRVSSSRGR